MSPESRLPARSVLLLRRGVHRNPHPLRRRVLYIRSVGVKISHWTLQAYGLHLLVESKAFKRKSLVCDIVEPFRPIIDKQIKNSINLKQFREEQFLVQNYQYILKWEFSPMVISVFLKAIMSYKTEIFLFIQSYYRCFMKDDSIGNYPIFEM